ncbi:calcineurin subunit B [Acrasis kona]|uniref:Calcineurin subunit B n=1 Tax=Acrasis kona TaxID=1008807 RepID=A0AAW2Z234_9EUKA
MDVELVPVEVRSKIDIAVLNADHNQDGYLSFEEFLEAVSHVQHVVCCDINDVDTTRNHDYVSSMSMTTIYAANWLSRIYDVKQDYYHAKYQALSLSRSSLYEDQVEQDNEELEHCSDFSCSTSWASTSFATPWDLNAMDRDVVDCQQVTSYAQIKPPRRRAKSVIERIKHFCTNVSHSKSTNDLRDEISQSSIQSLSPRNRKQQQNSTNKLNNGIRNYFFTSREDTQDDVKMSFRKFLNERTKSKIM